MNQACYYECGREATGVIQERYMCAPCYLDQEERHEKIRATQVKPYQNNRTQYTTRSPAFDVLEAQPIGSVIRELRELRERRPISQLLSEDDVPDLVSDVPSYVVGLNGGYVLNGEVIWPDGRPIVLFGDHQMFFESLRIFREEAGIDPTVWGERTVELAECLNRYGLRNFHIRDVSLTPLSEIERLRDMVTPIDDTSVESSSSEEEDISGMSLQEALDNYEYTTRLLGRCRETYGEDHPEYYRVFNIYCRAIHALTRVRRESI